MSAPQQCSRIARFGLQTGSVGFPLCRANTDCIYDNLIWQRDIYVFDDSFSALDFRTDARLRAAIRRELGAAR
ncbi:MAG: hypothetical protein B7Z83_10605, partial [Thiomonas sp. 20-64-5]